MARNRFTLTHASLLSIILHGFALAIIQRGDESAPPGAARPPLEVKLVPTSTSTVDLAQTEADAEPSIAIIDETGSEPAQPPIDPHPESSSAGVLPPEPAFEKVYRGAAMLHQRPIPLVRIELSDLARQFPGAHAGLSVLIDETGKVDDVRIRDGSHPGLAQHYENQVRQLRFVPGKISGQAVPSELIIELIFPPSFANANALPD